MGDSQKMKITRRAYELWQQAGEPKDRDEEFYLQAERELNEAPENAITATIRRHRLKDVSNFTLLLNLLPKLHLTSIAMKFPKATSASLVLCILTRRPQDSAGLLRV